MRLVLKNRRGYGQHDVREQDKFGVEPYRAIDGGDKRHLDVQNVHQDLLALPRDLVVPPRAEEVEALGADRFHECWATACQNHDAIIRVGSYRMKKIHKLLMRVASEQ